MTRYRQGEEALRYLRARYPDVLRPGARVLDVGGGNGGFLLPFAEELRAIWTDVHWPHELRAVAHRTGVRIACAMGAGERLPLRDGSLDLALCVETIEHVDARATGAEIARVLRPGGLCYITTPARLRFLLRGDPHYGVPALLLLPDALQRSVYAALRRQPYEVTHVFWSVRGIARNFPGMRVREITSKNWAGALRRLDWDWIVMEKMRQVL